MSVEVREARLARPAAQGVRRLVLSSLVDSQAAASRLSEPKDGQALHDFRVALRRLRTALSAYRGFLGKAASRKMRRKLRRLSDSTNPIRDAEVQLAILAQKRDSARAVESRVRAEMRRDRRKILSDLIPAFAELAQKIRRRLPETSDGGRVSMREALACAALESERRLRKRLARIHSIQDVRQLHKARISAKRLRYVIEPFEKELAGGAKAVRELKSIQDSLGKLHDAQDLETRLRAFNAGAARALDKRLRIRERELFGRIKRRWLHDGAKRLPRRPVIHLAHGIHPAVISPAVR